MWSNRFQNPGSRGSSAKLPLPCCAWTKPKSVKNASEISKVLIVVIVVCLGRLGGRIFGRRVQQIAHQVVYFLAAQRGRGRHEGARADIDLREFGSGEKMKGPIRRLEREGKIVVYLKHPGKLLTGKCDHRRCFLLGRQILIGIKNNRADLLRSGASPVEGKVATDKSSFAVDHMTVGALCFPEEESFPAYWIPGELHDIPPALQDSQVADDLTHLLRVQG